MPLPLLLRRLLPLARASLPRRGRPPADAVCLRAIEGAAVWRAGAARAAAATGWGCCEAGEGEEQEMLRLQDSTAPIPLVSHWIRTLGSSRILTLIERG
jgi:hypothetical protein